MPYCLIKAREPFPFKYFLNKFLNFYCILPYLYGEFFKFFCKEKENLRIYLL